MKEFDHLKIPLKVIEQATNNFDQQNLIAQGGFGKVYKAEINDLSKGGRIMGAVKLMKRLNETDVDISFKTEITCLSSYKHENLISLIGYCDESGKKALVYEYADKGSLYNHLNNPNLTWIQRLKICVGAACGLEYLHNPSGTLQSVLHLDIKSDNILLDEYWKAKIADFGLAICRPVDAFRYSHPKGTIGYCEPNFVEDNSPTKESDVYSFGVVLFEVLCSRPSVDDRYEDYRQSLVRLVEKCYKDQTLHTIIDADLRQQINGDCFDMFVEIAYQCLKQERTERPSMDQVVSMLESALKCQTEQDFKDSLHISLKSLHWAITGAQEGCSLDVSQNHKDGNQIRSRKFDIMCLIPEYNGLRHLAILVRATNYEIMLRNTKIPLPDMILFLEFAKTSRMELNVRLFGQTLTVRTQILKSTKLGKIMQSILTMLNNSSDASKRRGFRLGDILENLGHRRAKYKKIAFHLVFGVVAEQMFGFLCARLSMEAASRALKSFLQSAHAQLIPLTSFFSLVDQNGTYVVFFEEDLGNRSLNQGLSSRRQRFTEMLRKTCNWNTQPTAQTVRLVEIVEEDSNSKFYGARERIDIAPKTLMLKQGATNKYT